MPVIKKKEKKIKGKKIYKKKPPADLSRKEIKPDTKSTALYQSRRFNQGRGGVAESIQSNTELGD